MEEKFQPRYMMATKATHLLGDISSKTPSLAFVYNKEGEDYIGNWVEGFGFIDIKFPVSTTRDLTKEEIAKYDGNVIGIGNTPMYKIKIKS